MVKNERFLSKKTVKFDKNQQKINGFDQKNNEIWQKSTKNQWF